MKKIFTLLIGFSLLAAVTEAQEKKRETFIEFQPIFSTVEGGVHSFAVQGGILRGINDLFSVGAGFGIGESFHFDTNPFVPIFARAHVEKTFGEITPFASFDMGYSLNTEDFAMGWVLFNPTVGVRFRQVYLGLGYQAQVMTQSGGGTNHTVNLRLGYYFGQKAKQNAKAFFRRTYFELEAGYGIGLCSGPSYEDNRWQNEEFQMTYGSNAFLHVLWAYGIDENWSVGIGTGGEVFYDSYKNIDEHKVYVSMPLFVRGKYTFFDEEASVRPFVALDLGYLLALDGHQHDYGSEQKRYRSGLIAEPQVGVIFKNKYSLSLGYHPDSISVPCYGESFEHSSKQVNASSLRIHLGVRF